MSVYQDIVILAVFIFFYSTVAGAIERTWISGAISGNLTTTAALYAASDAAEGSTPVLGYTVSYAVSNVLLTFLGPVIVFAV